MDKAKPVPKRVKCACPGCGVMTDSGKKDEPVYCTPEHGELAKIIKGGK